MTAQDLINLSVDVKLKKKFVSEVLELYKQMTKGYYPDITFLSNEGDIIDLMDNNPELDTSLKYMVNYYLTHKWHSK